MRKLLIGLLAVLLSTPCFAQVNWAKKPYFDFSGGLNDTASPILIKDNESPDLQNVVFDKSGYFETRSGYAKLNSTTLGASLACTGIKYYEPTSGTQFLAAVFDDGSIRKMDYSSGPDGTWDDITGSLSFVNNQNILASFAVGEDTLLIEDGLDSTAPYKWTGVGNAAALGGSPPNASIIAYHKNHAFAAGNDSNPSTLYFSDINDIENWTTGLSGSTPIETNDGSIIRALIPGFDALYIFKDKSIWRLTGSDKDTFRLQRMISDVGTLSQQSVGLLGSDIIFLSDQGDVFLYDGAVGLRKISSKIQDSLDALSFDRFQFASGAVFDDDYYVSATTGAGSDHDRVLYLDAFHLAWSKFTGFSINAMAVADNGSGQDMLVFGDYGGFTYKYPSGTNDAGSAIDAYYVTKQFYYSDLSINKTLKKLFVFADEKSNYSVTTEIRSDFSTSGTQTDISLLGPGSSYDSAIYDTDIYGGGSLIVGEIEPNENGKFFQIKYLNGTLDQPFTIKGQELYIEQNDRI